MGVSCDELHHLEDLQCLLKLPFLCIANVLRFISLCGFRLCWSKDGELVVYESLYNVVERLNRDEVSGLTLRAIFPTDVINEAISALTLVLVAVDQAEVDSVAHLLCRFSPVHSCHQVLENGRRV